jgi:hypothetical protein
VPFDLWGTLLSAAEANFMLTGAFSLIGSTTTAHSAKLAREQVIEIKLRDLGIPETAHVLSINTTAAGSLIPLRWHGNVLDEHPPGILTLYGAAYGDEMRQSGEVSVAITWLATSEGDIASENLVTATRAYAAEHYAAIVVPANVAVEASLGAAMALWAQGFAGKARVDDFLSGAATYSHQLNILTAVVCHATGMPSMDAGLRGLLNRLRSLRNDVAHRGATSEPLSKQQAAELLTAAVFGVHYARLLLNSVQQARDNGRLPTVPSDRG